MMAKPENARKKSEEPGKRSKTLENARKRTKTHANIKMFENIEKVRFFSREGHARAILWGAGRRGRGRGRGCGRGRGRCVAIVSVAIVSEVPLRPRLLYIKLLLALG